MRTAETPAATEAAPGDGLAAALRGVAAAAAAEDATGALRAAHARLARRRSFGDCTSEPDPAAQDALASGRHAVPAALMRARAEDGDPLALVVLAALARRDGDLRSARRLTRRAERLGLLAVDGVAFTLDEAARLTAGDGRPHWYSDPV